MVEVQIILGSTRPGRISERIAKWVLTTANSTEGLEAEIVDLADYTMPLFDEPISPQFNPDRHPGEPVKRWLEKLAAADAYVLVTPEYNRSYSAVMKNALDYVDFQLAKKPVALVAHGTTGGAQAVAHLRGVLPGLLTFTVPKATFLIGRVSELMDESGELAEAVKANPYGPALALKATLEDLKWYGEAMQRARND